MSAVSTTAAFHSRYTSDTTAGPAVSTASPREQRSETVRTPTSMVRLYRLPGWQNIDRTQPVFDTLRPGGHGQRGATQTIAMAALRVDMQFGRHLGIL